MTEVATMKDMSSSRRGSALLIVLGMLSFMIVSAVAFSVYMRMSRAPSSYLRRNISSRHLVKAALARAIEDIDDKIGNDPYPGVGVASETWIRYTAHDGQKFEGIGDSWNNRVFCPYAERRESGANSRMPGTKLDPAVADISGDLHNYVDFDTTAAVLTLESLGYIPAPIVNQARYWSRCTETARWRRFNYDLGRWAYVAINVSDLLDVNSIRAYTNRNSGAFGRLSLASAAKTAGTTGENFDNFVTKTRGGTDSQIPLTSVLDFNLAAGNSGVVESPFYSWVKSGGGNNGFYGNSPSNEVAPLMFVTDSWFPSTNQFQIGARNDNQNYYLSRADHQPFTSFSGRSRGFLEFLGEANTGKSYLLFDRYLRAVGSACLYDYLDRDSTPVSLAIPSVEQIPMVVGIAPLVPNLKFTITKPATPAVAETGGGAPEAHDYWERKETQYTIKLDPLSVNINATLLYPFKRIEGQRQKSFRVQALVRLYLGAENMPMRATADDSPLRPLPNNTAWAPGSKFDNSAYTFVSPMQNVPLPNPSSFDRGEDEESLVDVQISFKGDVSDDKPFVLYSEKQYPNHTAPEKTVDEQMIKAFNWQPYFTDGTLATWKEGVGFDKTFTGNLIPNIAVWLRVIGPDDKTVDLVPATLRDDQMNNVPAYPAAIYTQLGTVCGVGMPLFNFKVKDFAVPVAQNDLVQCPLFGGMPGGTPAQPTPSLADDYGALFCFDPRYNYAPEDWFAEAKGYDANRWIQDVQDNMLGKDGRDSDVFMFVSNQEYLQSLGELAFLPRVQDFRNQAVIDNDNPIDGDFFDVGKYNATAITFTDRKGFNTFRDKAANRAFYWRTNRAYRHDAYPVDPLYDLVGSDGKRIFDDDGRGPRVNPYTDSSDIFLTAIADTPYDYWMASTNKNVDSGARAYPKPTTESMKCCFNKDSQLAKVSDSEIRDIANVIGNKLRSQINGDWLAAYNDLDWYGNGDPQCFLNDTGETKDAPKLQSTAMNEVDRKFLYSFWRNCFGNRQQLFLVFVRAEPSVLGGAQQGGRAVALVWRDPAPPAGYANRISRAVEKYEGQNENDRLPPHRTRVLFYHQFE